jgi:uncharacterized membrane protein YgcG
MLFGLLVIGLILLSTAIRGTQHELGQQLTDDLFGSGGFLMWMGAILGIGAVGYIPGLRMTSRYLLGLVLLVMFVRQTNLLASAQNALQQSSSQGPAPPVPIPQSQEPQQQSSSSGGSGGVGSAIGGGGGGGGGGSSMGQYAELAMLLA